MRGVLDVPDDLKPIADLLAAALTRVEDRFDRALHADLAPVDALCKHVESYRGKMLRPTLSLLCGLASSRGSSGAVAEARSGHARNPAPSQDPRATQSRGHATQALTPDNLPDPLLTVAAVVEMVHMATLVHDDVLDEADTRRRGRTVNSLHGNEAAVILGDYLIAAAYHLCAGLDDPHYARRIGRISMDVCSGELLQLSNRTNFELSEQTYFEIVSRKTGALVAVACELGARAAGAPRSVQEALFAFGRDLGIAFQIQDDLLDLIGDEATVGKSVRKDLQKGKLTLPMIHHLATADAARRDTSLDYIRAAGAGPTDPAADADFAAALDQTASVRFAEATARRLVDQARDALRTLAPSPALSLLAAMADAVIDRAF